MRQNRWSPPTVFAALTKLIISLWLSGFQKETQLPYPNMKSRTWEEEIYWKNFHFSQFSLNLPTDFHQHLTLPKKFSDYMRTKLPEQVVLKVNGVSWNVNLKKNKDDIMFHGDGWEEFADAYSLKKADVLVFKYNRRECFEVWLFDRASSCEKEASYFVRKPQQHNSDNGDDEEDHNDDCSSEDTAKSLSEGEFTDDTSQEDHDDCHYDASRDRRRIKPVRTPRSSSAKTARSKDVSDDPDESDENFGEEYSISEEAKTTPYKAATTKSAGILPTNAFRKRKRNGAKGSGSSLYSVNYKSNRRNITDEEIANALRKAKVAAETCVNSFIVLMRPSCVYKRFFMTIPSEWELKSHLRTGQEVSLRMQGEIWECRIYKDRTKLGFQGSRWQTFVRDNFLEEFDVCLFVPSVSKNEKRFVLDVSIFRVVPEVVPPTLVTLF